MPLLAIVPSGGAATRADPAVSGPLAGLTVNVDPGHNPGNARSARRIGRIVRAGPIRTACDTTGAVTSSGWPEHAFTLQLATRVARRLRAKGATVAFTHALGAPAWGPCITDRARIGNLADVSVSLHADGNLARGARGFHVIKPAFVRGYTGDVVKRSGTLAVQLRDAMRRGTSLPASTYLGRAGIDTRRDLGGLLLSDVPKVFLEAGNLRHASDARLLRSPLEQERIAAAVVEAVVRWRVAEQALD